MMWVFYLVLGLSAGIASGLFGIGGGVILIPAFIYLIGLTQHQAQGTTLAIMVLPIGLLAALKYYFYGNVRLDIAAWVCIGFFVGGFFGAVWAHAVSEPLLKKLFGVFLLFVSLRMIFVR
jgi:uncharacterized membrane protein YfcA